MVDRLPSGGDVGRVFHSVGEKAKPTKEAVANFFKAHVGDLAPVPQKLSESKDKPVSTFDSFRATINLDNTSFKEFTRNAATFSSIASTALTSVIKDFLKTLPPR